MKPFFEKKKGSKYVKKKPAIKEEKLYKCLHGKL